MKTLASLTTGKGASAISCIEVFGPDAVAVVGDLLSTKTAKEKLAKKSLLVTEISDDEKLIDQVVIGFEGEDCLAINCHGNPLITEMVMNALQKRGVEPVDNKQLLFAKFSNKYPGDTIKIEREVCKLFSKTLQGTKIINNQVELGLKKTLLQWQDKTDLQTIKQDCQDIFKKSKTAKLITNGAKVIIAGAPNSGKSTLLNSLCGREKAIVADVEGTTRDWIQASCTIESLWLDLFDTAGLDDILIHKSDLDFESQKRTLDLLETADMVLYIVDAGKKELLAKNIFESHVKEGTPIIAVLNKIDTIDESELDNLNSCFDQNVRISAKDNVNIDQLIECVRNASGVENFNPQEAVCFTPRQEQLCRKIIKSETESEVKKIINELLEGKLAV